MMSPEEAAENIMGRIHWSENLSDKQKCAVREAIIEGLTAMSVKLSASEEAIAQVLAERDGRLAIFLSGARSQSSSIEQIIRGNYLSDAKAMIERLTEIK